MGVALAGLSGAAIHAGVATLALLASLLMQAITNLQNDVGFTVRGGEQSGRRTGLPRATALGLLTAAQVRTGIMILASFATAVGVTLAWLRGWPVLALGAASLAGALAYMGGPKPIAYTPWGEFTVFVFFGWVAVGGTYWLMTGSMDAPALLAASGSGALAAAALALNNQRDRAHDASIARRTFAVVWGPAATARLYTLCLAFPLLVALLLSAAWAAPTLALPVLLAPQAWALRRDFLACPGGLAFNPLLLRTFRLVHWYSAALALGALLAWP